MKKTTSSYVKAPHDIAEAIGKSVVIKDFLPSPEELAVKEKTRKITINLSENSLVFFIKAAKKYHVSYQNMIKNILDKYSDFYKKNS